MKLLVLNATTKGKNTTRLNTLTSMEMESSTEILLASSPDNLLITAYYASTGLIFAHFKGSQSPRKGITLVGKSFIAVAHISYSPSPSASIHLYNWWSSNALHHLPLPEPVSPLVSTPDGMHLFSGGISGYIHVQSVPSGRVLRSVYAHSKAVCSCIVNNEELVLISGGDDGTIAVFSLIQLLDSNLDIPVTAFYCFLAHDLSVTAITTTGSCGLNIISCSLDCTCKFWSISDGVNLIRTVSFPCMLWCATLDPALSKFYVGGSDGCIYVGVTTSDKRCSDPQVVALSPEHSGGVTAMTMINGGRNLVSASEDGKIWVWDIEKDLLARVIADRSETINNILVAKGVKDGNTCGDSILGSSRVDFVGENFGYCCKEIRRPARELSEMKETLSVVVEDRRRGLDILEGTICTYQRLLRLILKEANGGVSFNNDTSEI